MTTELIVVLISTAFVGFGVFQFQKVKHLTQHGKKVKAVIFKSIYKSSSPQSGGMYYPVVRFKTEQEVWITKELEIGTSWKKEDGTKLEVWYDPEDPENFTINSTLYLKGIPSLFLGVGLIGWVISVLELLELTDFFR